MGIESSEEVRERARANAHVIFHISQRKNWTNLHGGTKSPAQSLLPSMRILPRMRIRACTIAFRQRKPVMRRNLPAHLPSICHLGQRNSSGRTAYVHSRSGPSDRFGRCLNSSPRFYLPVLVRHWPLYFLTHNRFDLSDQVLRALLRKLVFFFLGEK